MMTIHITSLYNLLYIVANISSLGYPGQGSLLLKLATVVDGDSKTPFSLVITLRCKGECYSFP